MAPITYYDFPTICRLCLNSGNLQNVFLQKTALITFNQILDIKISEDDLLPKNFCNQCVDKLNEIFLFLTMCRDSHDILLNIALQEEDKMENLTTEEIFIKIEEDLEGDDSLDIQPEVFNLFGSKSTIKTTESDQSQSNENSIEFEIINDHDYLENNNSSSQKRKTKKAIKIFSCNYCRKNFSTVRRLEAHIRYHAGIKPFKCDMCRRRFTHPQDLRQHKFTHISEKPIKCTECDWSGITKFQLSIHMTKHNGIPVPKKTRRMKLFKCTVCDRTLTRKNSLKVHMRTHTDLRPHVCEVCGKGFRQKSTLKKHMFTHAEKISCTMCQMKFNRKASLDLHMMKRHSGDRKPRFPKSLKDPNFLTCFLCEARYTKEPDFWEHILVHEQNQTASLLCSICGDAITSVKEHVQKHLSVKSLDPFKCEVCGKTFRVESVLKRHMNVHEGSHFCKFCKSTFRTSKYLGEHLIKKHPIDVMNERNLQCQFCKKIFLAASRMRRHLMVVHGCETQEKPKPSYPLYPCPYCGKMMIKSNLKIHLRIHTGEKPYSCQFCDEKFRVPATLMEHENIHKGIKPFECVHCKKTFRHASSKRKHVRRGACLKKKCPSKSVIT